MRGGIAMAFPLTLLAGVLMFSGVQASDIADGSENHGFLSKFMALRSGSSKSSIGENGKFMAYHLKHMEPGGRPKASSDHNDLAEDLEPQNIADKDEHKDVQKLFTNEINTPIGLSTIGVVLFLFAAIVAMVRVRMRRGMQPAIAFASSGRHGIDMSIFSVDNNTDLKPQGSCVRIPEQGLRNSEIALAQDMHADIKSTFAVWDSFGLGEVAPGVHVENIRASELQHGRAAMTAVFFISPQKPRSMQTLILANEREDEIMGARDASEIHDIDIANELRAIHDIIANEKLDKFESVLAQCPRPPPLVVGVAGGTASGKTALTANIAELLGASVASITQDSVASITQDSFYRDLTAAEMARIQEINFDVPEAFDFDEMEAVLTALKRGDTSVRVPTYDFVTNARRPRSEDIVLTESPRVVFFEGILALHSPRLRELMDLKIFIDVDSDVRLVRRIRRDVAERGRDVDGVLRAYEQFVKPAFEEFVLPTKRHADVVVPRGAENTVAIDLLVRGIRERTQELLDIDLLEWSAQAVSSS